jgi:hypothetical protein
MALLTDEDDLPRLTSSPAPSDLPMLSPKVLEHPATQDSLPTTQAIDEDAIPLPRPRLPIKSKTERPPQLQRQSWRRLGRRSTQLQPRRRAITRQEDSDSDSDSSSSEDGGRFWPSQPIKKSHSGSGQGSNSSMARVISGASHVKNNTKQSTNDKYSRFSIGNDEFKSRGRVSKRDGRLKISLNETAASGYLAKALDATFSRHLTPGHKRRRDVDSPNEDEEARLESKAPEDSSPALSTRHTGQPKLNIVIMVIGSRGDIQPFLKIGKILKEQHGHKVRIATHPAFKSFVETDSQLEFFSVGGDPSELMAFMVKNPGLIPSLSTVKAGEIGRRRDQMFEMFQGLWRACINATDDETDIANIKMMGDKHPFVADAIIANPPCFAHIHCAEKLGIPMHLMFTMPWSPTQAFPHPLANVKKGNVDLAYANYISYPLVDMMTWQG